MNGWHIQNLNDRHPAILSVGNLGKIGNPSVFEISGANFTPQTSFTVDWAGSSGQILESQILSPESATISATTDGVGEYTLLANNNNLSSALWGEGLQKKIKFVSFDTGWIDCSTNGPDLGVVESSLNSGASPRNLANSGLVRTTDGITKDVIGDRVFAVFKDYPLNVGSKTQVIISNYQNSAFLFGAFYDSVADYREESLFSCSGVATRFFCYSNDGRNIGYSTQYPFASNQQIEYNKDYLIEIFWESEILALCKSFEILSYGADHDSNVLLLKSEYTITKYSENRIGSNAFFGVGFWTTSTNILTQIKAFKIS